MKDITLIFVVLLSILNFVRALECYACRDCQEDFMDEKTGIVTDICPRNPLDRKEMLTRCIKEVEKDGKINRGCSTVTDCDVRERASKCSLTTTGTNAIERSCSICCEGNKCNSAAVTTICPALFLLSSALALYHVKV